MVNTVDSNNTNDCDPENEEQWCYAGKDGDCIWSFCPQLRDNEPATSGRDCPRKCWYGDGDE